MPSKTATTASRQEQSHWGLRAQWTLWAVIMTIFLVLSLTRHFEALLVAIVVSSLVWYGMVPRAGSRFGLIEAERDKRR